MRHSNLVWLRAVILAGLIAAPDLHLYTLANEQDGASGQSERRGQDAPDLAQLREVFQDAEKALKIGQWSNYQRHKRFLQGYPLVAYLEYAEIGTSGNSPGAIKGFIDNYPDFPNNRGLYKQLLEHYYTTNNWQGALDYQAENYDICLYLLSLHRLKRQREEILTTIKELWLDGHYFNEKCATLLQELRLRLYQNRALLWDRIAGALKQRNWRTVREIRHYVEARDRGAYNALLKLRRNKRAISRGELSKLPKTHSGGVAITYALSNYPSDYITEAYELYARKIKDVYPLSRRQRKEIEYNLGLFLTIENEEDGFAVMKTLDPTLLEEEEHEWRARSAIRFAQWQDLIVFIGDFPPQLQQDSAWLYWQGYALEKTGSARQARDFFRQAAKDRSFYGFLAAEEVGAPKVLNHTPASYSQGETVLNKPSFQRFFELQALGRERQALREWEATIRNANRDEVLYLASAAYARDWYYHSIRAFAVISYWDDLLRRFPLPYRDDVLAAARKNRLQPALVYAIMRTESSFRPDIASSAGAVGLMQLLPSTGRSVMRRMNYRGSRSLLNPQTSIDVGSAYLRQLLDQNKGNLVLTIASYNAGPYAAREWLPRRGSRPAVEWIETVPYGETRKYLRSILYAQVIFDWRLGGRNPSVSRNLQSVRSRS